MDKQKRLCEIMEELWTGENKFSMNNDHLQKDEIAKNQHDLISRAIRRRFWRKILLTKKVASK